MYLKAFLALTFTFAGIGIAALWVQLGASRLSGIELDSRSVAPLFQPPVVEGELADVSEVSIEYASVISTRAREAVLEVTVAGSWAESNVALGGEALIDVDLESLDLERLIEWRSSISEVQGEYKADFISSLPDFYTSIDEDAFLRSHMVGMMDIYYPVKDAGSICYVHVPEIGNEKIYSLRDAAQKVFDTEVYREYTATRRKDMHALVEKYHPEGGFRVEESEDGSHYVLWGTVGGYENILGMVSDNLIF